jgi:hypothetical protein
LEIKQKGKSKEMKLINYDMNLIKEYLMISEMQNRVDKERIYDKVNKIYCSLFQDISTHNKDMKYWNEENSDGTIL